jgi:hypothetical protein
VEEQTVEVVRDHEDGSRMGMAFSSRRVDEAERKRPAETARETDSAATTMEGIFGQPQERNPA